MENLILFDDKSLIEHLKPFTYTRPIGDLRVGILTIREKWEKIRPELIKLMNLEPGQDPIKVLGVPAVFQ